MRFFLTIMLWLCITEQVNAQLQHFSHSSTTAVVPKKTSNNIKLAGAHWLTPDTIVVATQFSSDEMTLATFNAEKIEQTFPLAKCQISQSLAHKYPHLQAFQCFTVKAQTKQIKQLLKQPLIVYKQQHGDLVGTYVQTANVIDALYTSGQKDANEDNELGARLTNNGVQFKLWAPTALAINVQLFDKAKRPTSPYKLKMREDKSTGIWSATTSHLLHEQFYRYQITLYHPSTKKIEEVITTDPYSLSLSTNSEHSQIVDLNHPSTQPRGWLTQRDNPVKNPEDNIFYETHIRDFSSHDTTLKNKNNRGKYLAFTEKNSAGMLHLKALRTAGINSIHLLPAFDIGTVDENSETVIDINNSLNDICRKSQLEEICALNTDKSQKLNEYLATLPSTSKQQQAVISALQHHDNYNWGYDPFHYTVPEGSYAINPDGVSRIVEFRTMVQTLHNLGFRVIMDVVYNHTHQAALAPTAVLDKIVPNYYQRLDPITGKIAQSTCCDNTATEHTMMEKLMIDSLVVWARDYKIDGFRFDLMGHQPKSSMLNARGAVKAVDADTYFYGEGWNFGEVANHQRFEQASQLALGGTEIGTFTDRLRDAVRGGAFNAQGQEIRKSQGIANGLATFPNELQSGDDRQRYLALADQLRIGLTGNLANYPLFTAEDTIRKGSEIPYGDQPTGYALDPADTINYVSKHDNQTLWDNNQYRIAYDLTTEQRVRMQLLSLAYPLFSQGIPFIHMGSEMLRSKGFLRDSYDYGDWFNYVDFTKRSNNYEIGLPPAEKDQQNWPTILTLRHKNAGKDVASAKDIAFSTKVFLDLVNIRMSNPLFRLTTAKQIIANVRFHNTGSKQQLGMLAMSINGNKSYPSTLVIFNNSGNRKTLNFANANDYQLHPIQQQGADNVVKESQIGTNSFSVPALTTAVFIKQ
ncbi:pullulanase-type alpha-1,6-glucosidase [Thalassotalea sp. PP2-459]|uniref:pullulanase-type alpha-1,6-glucosidase n=1 Tax=Thalassotalea sp. PP2-459 TaxID=1742724 RepID=UPI000941D411|nr:pullulanase-type alpha-1,6-glucosidase [Thalassotalea sp. PP2-459]OKY26032.1 alpha-amylase [Thalassotalea sp. PP2-459]